MHTSFVVLGLTAAVASASAFLTSAQQGPFGTGQSRLEAMISLGGDSGTPIEIHRTVPGGSDRQCAAYGADTPLYRRCRSGYQQMVAIEVDGTQVLISEVPNTPDGPAAVVALSK